MFKDFTRRMIMNNNSKDNKNLYLKLARRYIIATILIFVLLFTRQMIIQFQLNNYIDSSSIINMAGRQRMLSQKIVKEVLYIGESTHLDIKLSPQRISYPMQRHLRIIILHYMMGMMKRIFLI